jgi:hypothetical protein
VLVRIDIIKYQNEIEYVRAYFDLVREIYAPYPLLVEARIREALRISTGIILFAAWEYEITCS